MGNDRPSQNIETLTGMAYAAPMIVTYFFVAPIAILQGIYAKYFGLSLTTIAAVILAARLFDAVSDPVIGYFSDRRQARTGSRKALIAVGGVIFVVSTYFLYAPPAGVSASYFLLALLAFFLGFTLIEIPHLAWGGELATDLEGRSRLYTYRHMAVYLGTLIFFAIPLMPMFEGSEITPQTLEWSAIAMGGMMVPLLFWCLKKVPDGRVVSNQRAVNASPLWAAIVNNKPFLLFLGVYFFFGMGAGMWYGLLFIFVDGYLGLGSHVSAVYMVGVTTGLIAMSGWYMAIVRFGKKQVWGAGIVLLAAASAAALLLEPGETAIVPLYLIVAVSQIGMSSLIVAPSLLADITDYGRWKFGDNHAAVYFSVFTSVTKANAAFGSILGLAIAGWYGFDMSIVDNSEEAVFGLRLAIGYIPAALTLVAAVFIVLLPMNTRRHNTIRRRLEARDVRTSRRLPNSHCVTP